MDKTELQQQLSTLEPLEEPDPEKEQYATPPHIAADIIHRMGLNDDLGGKVADLGCGHGILTIGAALAGAEAVGVDIDPAAVETSRKNAGKAEVQDRTGFIQDDVRDVELEADAVVMNPPFGIQQEDRNLVFLQESFNIAPGIYALLHQSSERKEKTRAFIGGLAEDCGYRTDIVTSYRFPLPRAFSFHSTEKRHINVDLYRFSQV